VCVVYYRLYCGGVNFIFCIFKRLAIEFPLCFLEIHVVLRVGS
jgi:hypothetical protein